MRTWVRGCVGGAALCACAAFLTGCASPIPVGMLYTEVKMPVAADSTDKVPAKKGEAMCQSVLGLVATGDASIEAAAKNGGITKIHHVDWHVKNMLGIIGEYRTVVYGD